MQWTGVIPAMTTPFRDDLTVDLEFMVRHANWMVDNGCTGLVVLGSLGEGATLSEPEKNTIVQAMVQGVGARVPIVVGISALSTAEAVRLAQMAESSGAKGLMVLPPYVYSTDWREMKAHIAAILKASSLSCMLYNNPIAYKTDFIPEHVAELAAEYSNLHSVKESSSDIRRVTAIRALIGDRLQLLVGVDDAIVEGIAAGAVGWIAGLVNAFPRESVQLFQMAQRGGMNEAFALYSWFLPLLRLDVVPKFVQMIKLAQAAVNMGSATVRPPRLELIGDELKQTLAVIDKALKTRK
jgi:4-hydroxy-tetrahydrodipicolinate synthase